MTGAKIGKMKLEEYKLFNLLHGLVVCNYDKKFSLVSVNTAFYEMIGYSEKEIMSDFSSSFIDLLHPDYVQTVLETADKNMKNGLNFFSQNIKIRSKSKEYIDVVTIIQLNNTKKGPIVSISILSGESVDETINFARSSREVMDFIEELSGDAFFEYNIEKDIMVCSEKFAELFGLQELIHNFAVNIRSGKIIETDSRDSVNSKMLTDGDNVKTSKLHMKSKEGKHYWYIANYKIVRDLDGNPIRVIGKLSDITIQQDEINELTKRADIDLLTGLYNKKHTEYLISKTLVNNRKEDMHHTLMIIDIDNFKTINDRLGHLYGDMVIAQLADDLKSIFRSNDILGRIGGDEFFVLLKNCYEQKSVIEKAEQVCKAFRKVFSETGISVNISASIGIAKYPEHGKDLETLYKNSDTALYNVKASGKDRYAVYNNEMARPEYISNRTKIDSIDYEAKSFKENRIEFFFKVLLGKQDITSFLPGIIKLITQQFGFSKGYTFEFNKTREVMEKTFSWDDEERLGVNNILDDINPLDFQKGYEILLRDGVFAIEKLEDYKSEEERALLQEAGVKALVMYPIYMCGEVYGLIGFENSVEEVVFESGELEELKTICGMLSTFLVNYRLTQMVNGAN